MNPDQNAPEVTGNLSRMLRHLRLYEEVVLYADLPEIDVQDEKQSLEFLRGEYERELREYPSGAPPFDAEAALWAARLIYRSSQLLLYRQHKEVLLETLFPGFRGERTLAAILSADLTLRFLPSVLEKLHEIDPEDALLPILKNIASAWDYSAVGSHVQSELPDFHSAGKYPLLRKLYIDRVITLRDERLAAEPAINREIRTALGLYPDELWKNFDLIKTTS